MDQRIYVLNVGKGNCVVIPFPTRLSVIDIDDSHIDDKIFLKEVAEKKKMSLTNPVDWITYNFKGVSIFRFILTHPDMDHMSGLHELSSKKTITNFWSIQNSKEMSEEDFGNTPYRYEDWKAYKDYQSAKKGNTALRPLREEKSDCCWIQDGVRILSPTEAIIKESEEKEEYNHASYILGVKHQNGRQVILGGDATSSAQEDTTTYYEKNHDGKPYDRIRASVVIAPHHGSKHSTCKSFMDAISPSAVVVPVQWGADYDREFYKQYANVYATKTSGNVCIEMRDNKTRDVAIWTESTDAWEIVRTG